MTTKTYKTLPPPPYTPQHPPAYSETSPLIPKSPGYPKSGLRNVKNRKVNNFSTIFLTIIAALLTAGIILSIEIIFLYSIKHEPTPKPEMKVVNFKVGIIGAGPAGIGAAEGIRNEVFVLGGKFKDQNVDVQVEIIIYEEKSKIGGRMAIDGTSRMGIEVEDIAGGALDGDLLEFIGGMANRKEEEITVAESKDIGLGKVGYFDATHLVTKTYRPSAMSPWNHYLSLILKYGPSIWRAPKIPIGTMKSFNTFLRTMNEGNGWISSVKQMIFIMSMQDIYTSFSVSATERLDKNGIGDQYIRDILAPQVRRHTGQSVKEINDLALSMALEREDMGSQKAVNSGAFQMMLEQSLKNSAAILRPEAKVTKAHWEEIIEGYKSWVIQWECDSKKKEPPNAEILDKIIIAAPSNYTELLGRIEGGETIYSHANSQDIEYQPLYITFFLAPSTNQFTFLETGISGTLPAQILPIIDTNHATNSRFGSIIELSLLRSINIPLQDKSSVRYLYRLLSSEPISSSSFSTTLGIQADIVEDWTQHEISYAYPLMQPGLPRDVKGDFQLGEHVWTTNGAEGILGSSVELAWSVGRMVGRNVGVHIIQEVEEKLKKMNKRLKSEARKA